MRRGTCSAEAALLCLVLLLGCWLVTIYPR